MGGFVDAIRSVVRSELKPRSLHSLLGGRALRLGVNPTQRWLFQQNADGTIDFSKGLASELYSMLSSALQCEVETIITPFSRYNDKLLTGEIDLYGPMMSSPRSRSNILFSLPVHRLGLSALFRTRACQALPELAPPLTIDDLIHGSYQIAVMRDSRAHLVATTRLRRSDQDLLLCSTDEEAIERITLKGIARPAHLFLCNSLLSLHILSQHQENMQLVFGTPQTLLDMCDNAFAVRPDWSDALPAINEAIRFIMSSGGLRERMHSLTQGQFKGLIELPTYGEAPQRRRSEATPDKHVA
jgi:hypothetical protein